MTLPLHGFTDWQTSLRTADLVSANVNQIMNAGASFSSGVFDMQAYSSYSIKVDSALFVVPTAFGAVEVQVLWYLDLAATLPVYRERYVFFPDTNGSALFPNTYGRLIVQDAVHGPYITVVVTNLGPDRILSTITILGNSRSLGRRYVQNIEDSGGANTPQDAGILLSQNINLGGGASQSFIVPMSPGLVSMRQATVTTTWQMFLIDPTGVNIEGWAIGAGVDNHFLTSLPRTAVRALMVNTGGVVGTGLWNINSARDNW